MKQSNAGAYSTLKTAWHIDRIAEMRLGHHITPVEIQFIISDFCNHDCFFCAYRASNGLSAEGFGVAREDGTINHNPNRMMKTEKAEEILRHARDMGVHSIIFTGGGEPSAHPDHMRLYRLALDLGFDCSLNTNGQIFRDGWEEVLPLFKYVRFSIDAANAKEHAQIRGIKESAYGKCMSNLTDLSAEVKRQGSDCVVGSGYVVTPDNYGNVEEGVIALQETGCSYVRLAAMQSTEAEEAFPGDSLRLASEICSDVEKSCEEWYGGDFKVINLFDSVLGSRPDYRFCGFQQFVVYIGANYKVYRCCYTAYTDHGDIGDLTEMTFTEWFYSAEKAKLIESFDARSCGTCPLNEKNRVINYMIDPEPLHVNFV